MRILQVALPTGAFGLLLAGPSAEAPGVRNLWGLLTRYSARTARADSYARSEWVELGRLMAGIPEIHRYAARTICAGEMLNHLGRGTLDVFWTQMLAAFEQR